MGIRSVPRAPEDNYYCSYCKAEPDSPCHDKNGNIRGPHKARQNARLDKILARYRDETL